MGWDGFHFCLLSGSVMWAEDQNSQTEREEDVCQYVWQVCRNWSEEVSYPSYIPFMDQSIRSEMEFKEFEPRFKSAKTRFKLSAGLDLETFDTILSGTNYI